MHKNGVRPTLAFWQSLLKMLSSRRLYNCCLQAYTLYGDFIPADRIAYSCLINAALECGSATDAIALLPKYREADLDAKDYILFFRAYAAARDIEAAVAMFRDLKGQTTTLML